MQNLNIDGIQSEFLEHLSSCLSADDLAVFEKSFTLLNVQDNIFIFEYSDKAVYKDFVSRNINALRIVAGGICAKMPDIRFKYKNRTGQVTKETQDADEKPSAAHKDYKRGIRNIIASAVCMALAFVLAIVSVNFIANRKFKENFYSLSLNNTYDNFRIIQISDLHNSSYGKENDGLLSRIKKLSPDVIAMTGDCLDVNGDLNDITYLCTELAKIAPTYYAYGNNEWQRAFDFDMTLEAIDKAIGATDGNRDVSKLLSRDNGLKSALEATGVKVLFNETDTLDIGANKLKIFGTLTFNPSAFWQYAGDEFYKFISEGDDCIRLNLCHDPLLMETIKEDYWGDLVLSGDTHGGVVRLPGIGAVYSRNFGLLPERNNHYIYGKYRTGSSDIIVSSGLTNKGPIRMFNQPELVIVDVNKY